MKSLLTGLMLGAYDVHVGSSYLGQEGVVEDIDYGSSTLERAKLSNEQVHVKVVLNASGGALLPGSVVGWDTSAVDADSGPGKAVGAAVAAAGSIAVAGVVDPYLPAAGVPNGSTFLLIIEGPCKMRHDGSATVVIGSSLCTSGTGGRVLVYVEGTHDDGSRLGIALAAKSSGAGELFRARLRRQS